MVWRLARGWSENWKATTLHPAKIWYCPTGFSFHSKGHNVLYSVKSASQISHSRKNTYDRISDILNFLYFKTNFLCTETGLYGNVCVQEGKILWKMWHSKWISLVAQQFVSTFYIGGNPLWHVSDNGIISYKGAYCMRALLSAVPYNGAH